ncbi:unnamed protein product [Urochloa humidicola]
MARHHHHLLLLLPLVSLLITAAAASFNFRADLNHPYAGSTLSTTETTARAARASKARAARITARLARALGGGKHGALPASDARLSPLGDQGHSLTVGIGTPPQPRTLIVDTGSDLIWTQCAPPPPFRRRGRGRDPPPLYGFDPGRSTSFAFLPCGSRLCQEGQFSFKNCTGNRRCLYDDVYGSAEADGALASEAFTFGDHSKVTVPLGFGCGELAAGSLVGASGLIGLSPGTLSLTSQLSIPKFSYCLTPFADRKTSPLLFGAMADLRKYKTTGPIQTTSILSNPGAMETPYYYVPLVGLSLGNKRLRVPASSLAMRPDGTGGTIVDSGSTLAYLAETAFEAVRKAVVEAVRLPVANVTVEDYELCFALPGGAAMSAVETPPLVLHFDGGAAMVLDRDNYFQEPRAGLMCLAVGSSPDDFGVSIIGNVQQQNMHVLFDVRNQRFSFAPTQCDSI